MQVWPTTMTEKNVTILTKGCEAHKKERQTVLVFPCVRVGEEGHILPSRRIVKNREMNYKERFLPGSLGAWVEGGAEESASGSERRGTSGPHARSGTTRMTRQTERSYLRAPSPRREEAGYGSGGARAAGYATEAGYAELKHARVR